MKIAYSLSKYVEGNWENIAINDFAIWKISLAEKCEQRKKNIFHVDKKNWVKDITIDMDVKNDLCSNYARL